jgi:tellurite resistance protein TerC
MHKFRYLKVGLGVVLSFVGVKMLLGHSPYKIDTMVSLGIVVLILAASVVASLLRPLPSTASVEAPAPPKRTSRSPMLKAESSTP